MYNSKDKYENGHPPDKDRRVVLSGFTIQPDTEKNRFTLQKKGEEEADSTAEREWNLEVEDPSERSMWIDRFVEHGAERITV